MNVRVFAEYKVMERNKTWRKSYIDTIQIFVNFINIIVYSIYSE